MPVPPHGANTALKDRYSSLLGKYSHYSKHLADATCPYPRVAFYGCGSMFHSVIDVWNTCVGRKVDYCCDSDRAKWGKSFHGIECISPDALTQIRGDTAVFVTMDDFKPVADLLTSKGFPFVRPLYLFDLLASDYLAAPTEDVVGKLLETSEALADDRSREVLEAFVTRALARTSDLEVMSRVRDVHQYFPDFLPLSEHESFVDIGAFDGDTIREFVALTRARFDRVYAFELDALNFDRLKANTERLPCHERIQLFNLGLWDGAAEITYRIGDSASCIGEGAGKGRVAALDDTLADAAVTFIKMDIEGAEPRALRGARRIIQSQQPKLAICTYHDFRHLWEIPLYLKSLVPEYKIFLRHYSNIERETVCYAIR